MANLIQVKRSATTAVPGALQPGELAYSANGEVLFIGSAVGVDTANVVAIGGKRTPGTLTANQAIVVNASSWVDTIQTGKLIVGTVGTTVNIATISVAANTTQLGASATGSNTELVTSYAIKTYVDGKTASLSGGISDTQIVFSNNGVLAGSADFTWTSSTKTLYVSNTVNVNGTLTVAGLTTFNGDVLFGNATTDNVAFTSKISSSLIPYHGSTHDLGNSSFYWNNAYIGTGNFNGANVNGVLAAGNTTISGFANISSTLAAGSTTISGTLGAGNTTITGFANVSSTLAAGNTTITGFANVSSTLAAGNTTITGFANVSSTLAAGNTTVTGFANVSTTLQVGGVSTMGANVNVTGTVNATSGKFGNLEVSGNLTVTGTLTTINANNLVVDDSMIQLAANNTTSDVIDIGFFGSYEQGDGGAHEHTGLFRDASDGLYKLFQGLEPSPTTTVDTANTTFEYATLRAFLQTGGSGATGLVANATTIAITANSTLNVAITANTLTLSSPLVGTSGGTGLASFTAEDILVANSSNGFRKLALGTDGYVLQSNGTALVYNTLDGGTF